jgi:hypothetical protein
MALPIPDDDPVITATLFSSRKILPPIIREHVQEQRRRPGEEDRSKPIATGGIEVLVETLPLAQIDDGSSQTLRVLFIALGF